MNDLISIDEIQKIIAGIRENKYKIPQALLQEELELYELIKPYAEMIAQQRAEIECMQAQLSNLTTVTIDGKTITLAHTDTDAQDLSGMVSGILWDKDE